MGMGFHPSFVVRDPRSAAVLLMEPVRRMTDHVSPVPSAFICPGPGPAPPAPPHLRFQIPRRALRALCVSAVRPPTPKSDRRFLAPRICFTLGRRNPFCAETVILLGWARCEHFFTNSA